MTSHDIIFKHVLNYHYRRVYSGVIKLAREVYDNLSWGWNESVYREALALELMNHGYNTSQEIVKPIYYKGRELSHVNARLDLLISKGAIKMVIELKADSATRHTMIKAQQQCKRYLDLTNIPYGMVINFPERESRQVEYITICRKNNKDIPINLSFTIPLDTIKKIDNVVNNKTKKRSPVMNYLYNKENRDKVRQDNPEMTAGEITGYLSRKWKGLSESEKEIWDLNRVEM